MKKIPLTQNKVAIIDNKDFEKISKHSWYFQGGYGSGYAVRMPSVLEEKKRNLIRMHRVILDAPRGYEVDHINGNKLDNRRKNLRICLKSENHRNRNKQRNNTSGFKGVSRRKDLQKWAVHINVNGVKTSVGHFNDLIAAAKAYNEAAIINYGEFAKLNSI